VPTSNTSTGEPFTCTLKGERMQGDDHDNLVVIISSVTTRSLTASSLLYRPPHTVLNGVRDRHPHTALNKPPQSVLKETLM
jgi:hypothetical protein